MKRVDYDQLERDMTRTWKETVNADGDRVTAGQIRGAEVMGKLAAFVEKELDNHPDDPILTLQVLAAIASNAALGAIHSIGAHAASDEEAQKAAAKIFIKAVMIYLGSMVGVLPAEGVTTRGPKVHIRRKEVGDA